MEVYIKLNRNNPSGYDWISYDPYDPIDGINQTRAEAEKVGIFISSIPQPDPSKSDKMAILKVNNDTLEIYYEYSDMPLTPEQQEMQDLKRTQTLMQTAIDDLIMGGMM